MSLGTIVPRYNVPRNNVPRNNNSSRQLFHATIVPRNNCSTRQLFLSTIIPRSFTNGLLQRGWSSWWPKSRKRRSNDRCKWSSGWSGILHAPPFFCKWSFAKRTVLRMTIIKGTEEQELLQIIIQRIRPAPFLCKCSFAKRTVLQMTRIKGRSADGCKWLSGWSGLHRVLPFLCKDDYKNACSLTLVKTKKPHTSAALFPVIDNIFGLKMPQNSSAK